MILEKQSEEIFNQAFASLAVAYRIFIESLFYERVIPAFSQSDEGIDEIIALQVWNLDTLWFSDQFRMKLIREVSPAAQKVLEHKFTIAGDKELCEEIVICELKLKYDDYLEKMALNSQKKGGGKS